MSPNNETLSLFEYITKLWPIFVFLLGTCFAIIAAFLRVESKVNHLEEKYKEISEVKGDIKTILQQLGKIQGKIEKL